jgi:HKD family nuclease
MGILIILRNSSSLNLFRDIMVESIASKEGNECIICSGFIQEGLGNYFASQEKQLAKKLSSISLVKIVGVYNNPKWKNECIAFLKSLSKVGVKYKHYQTKKHNWHAKIFILLKNGSPILGIIGSSNLTSKAFSVQKNFNYECDVILWEDSSKMQAIIKKIVKQVNDPNQIINAKYELKLNSDLSVQQRLKNLEKLVLENVIEK